MRQYELSDAQEIVDTVVALDAAFSLLLDSLAKHSPEVAHDWSRSLQRLAERVPARLGHNSGERVRDILHDWSKALTHRSGPRSR